MRGSVAVQVPKVDPNRCGPDVRQGVNNRIAGSGTALCNTNVLQDRMYFEVKIINPDGASLRTPPAAPELRIPAALSCRFLGMHRGRFFRRLGQLSPSLPSPARQRWDAAPRTARGSLTVASLRAGKFCIGLSGPDTNLAALMSGANGNNKKERAQTKWTFIIESDQVPERFKAGDVISVSYDQSDYPTILNFHQNGHEAPFKSITSVRGDMRPAVSVSGQATLEMVFDEDRFSQTPPANFYPLMHAREMMSG